MSGIVFLTIEDHNLIAKMGDRTLVITDIKDINEMQKLGCRITCSSSLDWPCEHTYNLHTIELACAIRGNDFYGVVAEMLTERYDANEDGIIQKCGQSSDVYKCVVDNLLSDYAADINEEVYNGIVDALEELWKTT